jgi:hypothetical protein
VLIQLSTRRCLVSVSLGGFRPLRRRSFCLSSRASILAASTRGNLRFRRIPFLIGSRQPCAHHRILDVKRIELGPNPTPRQSMGVSPDGARLYSPASRAHRAPALSHPVTILTRRVRRASGRPRSVPRLRRSCGRVAVRAFGRRPIAHRRVPAAATRPPCSLHLCGRTGCHAEISPHVAAEGRRCYELPMTEIRR